MSHFGFIWKNLTRNPLRFLLNALAIFVAFLLFGVLGTIKDAFNSGAEVAGADRLVVVNKINFTQPLPVAYANKIAAVENVKYVTHANWFGGYFQEPRNQLMTFAVEPESYLTVYDDMLLNEQDRSAWLSTQTGVLIGENIAQKLGWAVGDVVPISSSIYSQKDGSRTWKMTVSGIFSSNNKRADTSFVLMHYKYFIETQSWGGDSIGWLTVTTNDAKNNAQVSKAIDNLFENSAAETKTTTEKAFNQAFVEQVGDIGFILTGVLLAAFFTILLIVSNSMIISIRERNKEIAVLKTLGFRSTRIFSYVLIESILLAIFGGLCGLAMAFFMVKLMMNVPDITRVFPNLVMTQQHMVISVVFMLLLGLASGFVPAMSALKMRIIDALAKD